MKRHVRRTCVVIDQDSPAFVERRLNGKKKNSRSKNRITKKKKKREGDMHGFNLLNALARNRRTKRTHILGRSFASISICNRMHAYTCILSLFLCLLLGIFHVAFSTCRQSIRTLERAA